ncbi:MAG: hypothetical protein EA425_04525 [Puniceicoccaceae bacterium]|nr:MAG: hypothetical protein EA425_04525 [Puniceicoccaceae bacterium]
MIPATNRPSLATGAVQLLACVLAAALAAQMTPNAPIENFRLPMFNEAGYRTWDLRGDVGRYLDANRVEVDNMRLRLYSGDEAEMVDTTILSPLAVFFPHETRAAGPGPIEITSLNFQISGTDWEWFGDTQTIRIDEDVRVVFRESVGNILK